MSDLVRCGWVGDDPIYRAYHDEEWGVPEWDDRALFEKLTLDGFQAGLSWITILKKRDNFRAAFDGFVPEVIVGYGPDKADSLLQDAGIIRHRGKIEATIGNARAYLKIQETGSFSDYLWQFTGGKVLHNTWTGMAEMPAQTTESQAMSKDLKKRGFKFCGPTICYAFMQAVGMVNDHTTDCFRYKAVKG
ncbi:MAG: DNA-3-methyladenine glycosylase I [Proteobacteria bacterium]|jgi:DNA-3-methyladenine glycosylase I|nr:DNA-3-methyladenine glycosylase I [Pseudomonadota bacterium]